MTVAVMEPVKVLALSVPPLPEKLLLDSAPTLVLSVRVRLFRKGRAVMPASMPDWRSMVEVEVCLAVTFSTICTVTLSPTMRARRSSNAGR